VRSYLTYILLAVFVCGSAVVPGDFILCIVEHDHIAVESAGTTHCTHHGIHHTGETCGEWITGRDRHAHLDIPLSVFSGAFLHAVSNHAADTSPPGAVHTGIVPSSVPSSPLIPVDVCSTGPPHHEAPLISDMLRTTVITT